MEFKTKKERDDALIALQNEEPPKNNVDAWAEEQKKKQEEILNATIAEEPVEAPQEPAEPPEESKEPQEPPEPSDEVITFRRSELPDILQPYKDEKEIIKQFAHARDYANRTEEQVIALAEENARLKEQQKAFDDQIKSLEEKQVETQKAILKSPPSAARSFAQSSLNDSIAKLKSLDDNAYVEAGNVREIFESAVNEINTAISAVNEVKETYNKKLSEFESKHKALENEMTTSKEEIKLREQQKATQEGLEQLQGEYPELKTTKPLIGALNCVENDVFRFADRILTSKYGNNAPTYAHRNAIINAYLRKDPELIAYCENNAITPASVNSTLNDIQAYATILNVDAVVRGQKIDPINGERIQNTSPYNGKPINYPSYISAYEAIKQSSGISEAEAKSREIEAEKRGQKALDEALGKKAEQPKTLGSAGASRPEDIGQDISKEQAADIIFARGKYIDFEEEIEADAMKGNRTKFHLYNRACKVLDHQPAVASIHWPAEIVR